MSSIDTTYIHYTVILESPTDQDSVVDRIGITERNQLRIMIEVAFGTPATVTYSQTDSYYNDVVTKASDIAVENEQYIKNLAGDPPKNTNPPTKSISTLEINEGEQVLKLNQLITQNIGSRTKSTNSPIKGVVQSELYDIIKNDQKVNEFFGNNMKGAELQKTLELPANGTFTENTFNQLGSIYGQYNQNTKYYKNPITYANPCAYAFTPTTDELLELLEEYGPEALEILKDGAASVWVIIVAKSSIQDNKKTHEGTKGVVNINDAKKNPKGVDKTNDNKKPKVSGKSKGEVKEKAFPDNPDDFNPKGLEKKTYNTKNGKIIKWVDKNGKAKYEWDEDNDNGSHYHIIGEDGNTRVKNSNGETHFSPGDPIIK